MQRWRALCVGGSLSGHGVRVMLAICQPCLACPVMLADRFFGKEAVSLGILRLLRMMAAFSNPLYAGNRHCYYHACCYFRYRSCSALRAMLLCKDS